MKSKLTFFYFLFLLPIFFHTDTAYAAAHGGSGAALPFEDDGPFGGLGAPDGSLALALDDLAGGAVETAPIAPIQTRLHDGLSLQIAYGEPAAPVLHNPYNHHLTLTSYDREETNEARVSLAFFAANGEIVHKPINKLFIAGSSATGMVTVGGRPISIVSGRTLFPRRGDDPEYASFLRWLAAINPENSTLRIAAAGVPAASFSSSGFSQWYHHTENWILWDIRRNLRTLIDELRVARPGFLLNGLGIYLYTRHNPCSKCGPTIDNVPPHFATELATISTELGGAFGPVKVFSSISSTHPYDPPHLSMIGLTHDLARAINAPSYQVAYAGLDGVVSNATVPLNEVDRHCHHFWIPKLRGVTFSMDEILLKATLNDFARLPLFLAEFSTHRHVAERVRILDFGGHNVEFTTKPRDATINPWNFYDDPSTPEFYRTNRINLLPFYLNVSRLNLHGTNARSAYIPDMLGAFRQLTHLNLSGAIAEYRDSPDNVAQPRAQLWTALRGLPLLTDLDLGSFQRGAVDAPVKVSNNITFAEFASLLSVPPAPVGAPSHVPFPSIRRLSLNGSKIFLSPGDAAPNMAGAILTAFIQAPGRATPPSTIDLSDNGPYMHISAAQAGIRFATSVPATNIIF